MAPRYGGPLVTIRCGNEVLAIHDPALARLAVLGNDAPPAGPISVLDMAADVAHEGLEVLCGAVPLKGAATRSFGTSLRAPDVRKALGDKAVRDVPLLKILGWTAAAADAKRHLTRTMLQAALARLKEIKAHTVSGGGGDSASELACADGVSTCLSSDGIGTDDLAGLGSGDAGENSAMAKYDHVHSEDTPDQDSFPQVSLDAGKGTQPTTTAKEDIVDMQEVEKNRDNFFKARVRRKVDGVWFSGTVIDIEFGATTMEKLYKLRYDDRDLQHLTLPGVKEASKAFDRTCR